MRKIAVVMVAALLLVGVQEAAAQSWTDQIYINVGFGVESGSSDLNDTKTFTLYDEITTVNSSSAWSSGNLLDVSAGLRVWRNLSIGAGYHQENNTSSVQLAGTAPHPIFFNRPRSFTSETSGLERKETATHLNLGWMIPIGTKVDVHLTAGPSFFRLQQGVVSDVLIAERGTPFTEVVVQPTAATEKRSVAGYNVGLDLAFMVWQNDAVRIGVGGFVRMTGATTDVRLLASDVETKVGGTQFGIGARLRF